MGVHRGLRLISTPQTLGEKLQPLEHWCNDQSSPDQLPPAWPNRPALHHFPRTAEIIFKLEYYKIKYYMLNSIVSSARLRNPTKRQKSLPFACIKRSSPSSENRFPPSQLRLWTCSVWIYFIYSFFCVCVWKMDFGGVFFLLKNGFNNFDHCLARSVLFGLLNVDWLIVKKAYLWLREEKKKKTPKKRRQNLYFSICK